MTNNRYTIDSNDVFKPADYADITDELILFRQSSSAFSNSHKATMFISFLKDHMIGTALVNSYPELVSHITSRQICVKHLELLFESSRANLSFQKDLETYIRHQLE
ncbi:hypothetical protein ACFQ21_17075 [Ohtaekwangia kribbensis]|jgi:hypothetical protein|uniref:DUF4476 domain-containing protein n=1 Tax=Ohtaekwangia kribbensis TaxID=688913 RepID=A0ABW3K450_9BACT